ncbi:MAG: hypothetical protein K0U38_00965 [Epsilonproteobacteria bacterium]|nr:hypothetical protein [Campylobacterota bacterium]
MKKGCLKLILTAFAFTSLYAESITFEKLYGTKEDDSAKSVITTDKGFLIIGYTEGDRDKREDVYLVHIDKSGNKLWSKSIGGEDREMGEALLATDDGYIAVGMTESFNGHRSKIYLIKLTKDGKMDWQKDYRSNSDSYYYGTGIVKTDKGYKVAGWENKLEFMDSEAFVYSFDINQKGERTTSPRRHGTEDDEKIYDIIKAEDGYLLIGETNHIDDDGINAYVLKIDNNGKKVWHKSYGWRYNEWAKAAIATDNGYLLVGTTESNRDKRSEIYVLKIDKNGDTIWQKTYGGEYNEEGFDVVADSDGYVIVGLTESNSKGRSDAYVIKIDKKGKLLWQKQYGGDNTDIAYGVTKSDDGYLVVGETESYNSKRKDVYVIKLDKEGNI